MTLAASVEQPDINSLGAHILTELPAYARPVFVRIQPDIDVTGTFKMVKGALRKQGYDPSLVEDKLYVLKPRSSRYEPLDSEFAEQVLQGQGGY